MVKNSEIPWGALLGIWSYPVYGFLHDDWSPAGWNNWSASIVSEVPFLGAIPKAIDNANYANDYEKNRGYGWSDVLYPTRSAFRTTAGAVASGINYVSSNIEDLYTDHPPSEDNKRNINPGDFF